jgi:acyl-CoA thioesterase-1
MKIHRALLLLAALLLTDIMPRPASAEDPQQRPIKILALGDSLTEGYGVPLSEAYPALLEARLRKQFPQLGTRIQVINAGIGGSTSASGPQRLRWHLRAKPDLILLALGANDMLRGLPAKSTEENLRKTLALAARNQVPVILAGIRVPPNYGKAYRLEFEAIYPRLAREFRAPFIPFLLEGVAGVRELNQEDGIHPNEKGQDRIASTVQPRIAEWIQRNQP